MCSHLPLVTIIFPTLTQYVRADFELSSSSAMYVSAWTG